MRIRKAVVDELIAHAREAAPLECCGLLLGSEDLIDQAIRARNLHQSPATYLIDPEDHFRAIRTARSTRRRVVGAYHSHPRSPAVPSPTDQSEANDTDLVYVIVFPGTADRSPEIRAYRLDEGIFQEVIFACEP